MCDVNKYLEIYKEIEKLQPEDTLQLVLEAETEEQQDFFEMLGNYLLSTKQKKVIERNLFWWKNTSVKERVLARVSKGGHGIPESDIERRYYESFKNLNLIIDKCKLIAFYDNTESFRRFAIYKDGSPIRLSKTIPIWFEKYIMN